MLSVKVFKIGEDFICGKLGTEAGEGNVKIINPLYLVLTDSGPKLLDVHHVMTDEKQIVVKEHNIAYSSKANSKVEEAYNKAISPIVQLGGLVT
jgi:hypothetical protein